MVVSDAKTYLGHKTTRVRSRKSQGYLETQITQDAPGRPRFILILGTVGAGKTTFLQYTRKVSAASQIDNKVLWLYIDFKKTTQNQNSRQFLYEELRSLIEADKEFDLGDWAKSIMPAYAEAIHNLERGPLFILKKSNKSEFDKKIADTVMKERDELVPYVEKIVRHAINAKPGFLVIDNVDQIDDDGRQNEIFSEAQAAAQRMCINIIMSLRESTFLRHRNSPVFDAFQFDSLYIDPPSVLPVLSRRFTYARQVLAGRKADLTLESGIHLKVSDISVFFNIVSQSVLASDAGFMIEMLSGGDIRRGLSLVREFLSSGHTTADRALSAYARDGKYKFPPHEIFKGAVLGKRTVYREEESSLPNLYDSKLESESLQLLRFHILSRLVDLASDAAFEGIPASEVTEQLHVLGVPSGVVSGCLKTLLDARAIRTSDGLLLSPQSKILPNRLAGYLIQELGSSFNYFDMCLVDSYIFQQEVWINISDLTNRIENASDEVNGVQARIDRAKQYLKYLSSIEERWVVECNRRGFGGTWGQQWLEIKIRKRLEEDMKRALSSAEKMAKWKAKSTGQY
jgi:hypothetical protein